MSFTPAQTPGENGDPDQSRGLFSKDVDYAADWRDTSFMLLSQLKQTMATKIREN